MTYIIHHHDNGLFLFRLILGLPAYEGSGINKYDTVMNS